MKKCCCKKASNFCSFGYVAADGTIITQGGDWTVVRLSVGRYRVTYATPMSTVMAPLVSSQENYATRDSITPRFDNVTVNGFDVVISEGDNGGAPNTPRDRDWSFGVPCGDPEGVSIAGPAGQDGIDGLNAPIATSIPIPDNEDDNSLRTGLAGTTGEVSDAGHNHPIRRLSNPGFPTLTYGLAPGSSSSGIINYDFRSEEESVSFLYRVQINTSANNGWNFINIPALVGFQQPEITIEGTYRSSGNPQSTMPLAPYMGNEANHWSSTNRVYIGPFSQKTQAATYFIALRVKYIKT